VYGYSPNKSRKQTYILYHTGHQRNRNRHRQDHIKEQPPKPPTGIYRESLQHKEYPLKA